MHETCMNHFWIQIVRLHGMQRDLQGALGYFAPFSSLIALILRLEHNLEVYADANVRKPFTRSTKYLSQT